MNIHSSILQSSFKANIHHQDNDGETRLEIVEQPKSRGFRFRYTCEGPSHGGVPGASSDKNKKTYPAVRIANYQGYARIVVQLVTNEENPRLHPHSLVGKQCQNGICTVQCGPKDMTATFPNLGIQHVTKKNVAAVLENRYIAAEKQLININDNISQDILSSISEEDRKRIISKAQNEAKQIDLSIVRLMFIAYLPDSNGAFTIMLKPVISQPIFDSKAPNAATLKICRMDCQTGSAMGGDEIYLLCDKVQKDDIQVRFVEEDMQGNELWEDYAQFSPTDVHRQYAIVFRTPAYRDQGIKQPVHVNVQLRRKSDGEMSEPRSYTFLPNKNDYEIPGKRKKTSSGWNGNSQGYNFVPSPSLPNRFPFQSPNSGGNKLKEPRPPPVKQENPQKCPLDPSMLFKINSIKQEPKSPQNQYFRSRESSFQGSPRSSCSPMSESTLSPAAPSPSNEPQYFPGTQIPIPRNAKAPSNIPPINFQRPINVANSFQSNNVQQFQASPPMQQETFVSVRQEQHITQTSNFTDNSLEALLDNHQYAMTSPMQGTGSSPIGDVEVPRIIGSSSWTNMQNVSNQTVTAEFFAISDIGLDQNHNPLQTIEVSDIDIVEQALANASRAGPGSGSVGMSSLTDPLMPAPPQFNDLAVLSNNLTLNNIMDDMYDIDSDAVKGGGVGEDSNYDFASALYDQSITSLRPPTPTRRALPSIQADGDVESDTAVLTHRMGSMNLSEKDVDGVVPQSQLLAAKQQPSMVSAVLDKPKTNGQSNKQTNSEAKELKEKLQQKDSMLRTLRQSLTEKEARKKAEIQKMASAIHDYSVSGDVRILLVLQRHLTGCVDENGETAIHVSVIHNQPEVLTALLDVVETLSNRDEIVNRVNKQRQTALQIAVLTDNTQAVIELLRAGADPLIPDNKGNHAVHVACRHGHADILKRLLTSRMGRAGQVDVKNHSGFGCFHLAVKAKKHNPQCLRLLHEHQCDVNMTDGKSGRTALHLAVELNNLVVVGCLVSECDADLEASTYDGFTPLHIAAAYDRPAIARLLIGCGANLDANSRPPNDSDEGETPLDLSRSDEMRNILNGSVADDNDEKFLEKYELLNEDLWSLNPTLKSRLCNLLNEKRTGSDWFALADRLALDFEVTSLKETENPAYALMKAYEVGNGTCDGLRAALMSIGRHDAVQILNKALKSTDNESPIENSVKLLSQEDMEDRNDSAIGSMPM